MNTIRSRFASRISLRVQLTVLMSLMLAASMAASYWVSNRVEKAALGKVQGYVDMLSETVQVSVSQLHLSGAEAGANLSMLRARLDPTRLRQISLFDNSGRLIARIPPEDILERETATDPLYRLMDVDIPLVENGRSLGYLNMKIALTDFRGLFGEMLRSKALLSALIFAVGFLAIFPIVGFVSRSTRALEAVSGRVALGDLDVRLPPAHNKELSRLTATFGGMIEKLRAQKELEARLAESERQAAIGRVVSGIAHDIRGPLNYVNLAVQQLVSIMEDQPDAPNPDLLELKRGVSLELHRINQTMADLLDFGRPTIHGGQPEDPASLLRESLEDARRRHPSAEFQVVLADENGGRRIDVNAALLRRALVNVIENAVEASPAPGSVRVGSQFESGDPDQVVLWVEDSGPGIPPDHLKQLFNFYFTTKSSGVGLGLALASKFVRDMGGEIGARNLPGGGARFEIRFPALPDGPP